MRCGQMTTDVIRGMLHRWLLLFTGEKISNYGFKTRETRRVVSFHVVSVVKWDTHTEMFTASLRHCLVAAAATCGWRCLGVGPREILRQCIHVMYDRIGCEMYSLAHHWYQQWSWLPANNQFLIKSLYVALTTRSALQWLCDLSARRPHYALYFVYPSVCTACALILEMKFSLSVWNCYKRSEVKRTKDKSQVTQARRKLSHDRILNV